jgi:ABC-type glycerol-3-phosphate transport system permease component
VSLTEKIETRLTSAQAQADIARIDAAPIPATTGRRTKRSFKFFTHLVLISTCLLAVAPFAWMVSTSLKTADNSILYPPQILPKPIVPRNYWDVISGQKLNFLLWTRNSTIVALLTVAGTTAPWSRTVLPRFRFAAAALCLASCWRQ